MIDMKIYVVQDLNYSEYEMLYVGLDKERANAILKQRRNEKYVYGSLWVDGKEVKSDIKEF